ncbi:MAG: two-component regulator propeller domain-containing protein, partial [Flammeovirgaceae bacterium]
NSKSLTNNDVTCIYEDRSGNLWIGTGEGLNKFDSANKTFEHFTRQPENAAGLSSDYVTCIYQDQSGFFWIATYGGGLNKFDPVTKTFQRFTHDPKKEGSLSNDIVSCVYQDRSGILWVGTYGGGLNRLDRAKNKFTSFTMNDGLPNDCVQGILEDTHGALWLSTNKGLCKFNPKSLTFHNYDVSDGLQGDQFNPAVHVGGDGKFYFGGSNGFNAFFPDSIKDNPYIPPVVITDFKVFEKSMGYGLMCNS